MTEEKEAVEHRGSGSVKQHHEQDQYLSIHYRQTPRTTQPGQLPARQKQSHRATVVAPGHAASRGGEPGKGYQSPPQSSSKPPDSAERCEWLSAAMRRAGRLARRHPCPVACWPTGPSTPARCWPPSRCASSGRCQSVSGSSPGLAPSPAPRPPTSTTAPAWTPSNAPPSPSATMSIADYLVGLGGTGEG